MNRTYTTAVTNALLTLFLCGVSASEIPAGDDRRLTQDLAAVPFRICISLPLQRGYRIHTFD
jgi:hypothetical protein